jgi:hypothetical protein
MSCGYLGANSDVMYRTIQFWFKTNGAKFLRDISDACIKYNIRDPCGLVLFVDFFPEIVGLRILPASSISSQIPLSTTDLFPFPYSEEKLKQAAAHLLRKFSRQKIDGILVFANYLHYSDTMGYEIFSLTMPHDTSGVDCISRDFLLAASQESDFRLIQIVSRNEATKIRQEFSADRSKRMDQNQPRPLSTRMCNYEHM